MFQNLTELCAATRTELKASCNSMLQWKFRVYHEILLPVLNKEILHSPTRPVDAWWVIAVACICQLIQSFHKLKVLGEDCKSLASIFTLMKGYVHNYKKTVREVVRPHVRCGVHILWYCRLKINCCKECCWSQPPATSVSTTLDSFSLLLTL